MDSVTEIATKYSYYIFVLFIVVVFETRRAKLNVVNVFGKIKKIIKHSKNLMYNNNNNMHCI